MFFLSFGQQRYIPRIKRQHQAASGFRRFLPFRSEKSKSSKSVVLFILSIEEVFTKRRKRKNMYESGLVRILRTTNYV
jgi:hypothetical protein